MKSSNEDTALKVCQQPEGCMRPVTLCNEHLQERCLGKELHYMTRRATVVSMVRFFFFAFSFLGGKLQGLKANIENWGDE